jgi:hypothetical protein
MAGLTRRRTVALVGCLGACAALPASASAEITTPEELFLDSFKTPKSTVAGPVSTAGTLTNGKFYVAEVSGTIGVYLPRLWQAPLPPNRKVCGTPESAPDIPTVGRPNAPVGQDAEFVWATAVFTPTPCGTLPRPYSRFQVDVTGDEANFAHPTLVGGPLASPSANHSYSYLLAGTGTVARFRQADQNTADNNGQLRILVRQATLADCGSNAACQATFPPGTTTTSTTQGSTGNVQGGGSSVSPGVTLPPAAKPCVSKRRFRIRLRSRKKDPLRSAVIRFNRRKLSAKRIKVRRTVTTFTAIIDLRGLPKGRYTVDITAKTKSGKTLFGKRVYRTCVKRRRFGTPPL